jgi:hypothetical protein
MGYNRGGSMNWPETEAHTMICIIILGIAALAGLGFHGGFRKLLFWCLGRR